MPAGAIGETGDGAGEAQIHRAFQIIGHCDLGIESRVSIRARSFADNFARDQSLHDLRSAVANLESDDIAHALLMGQIETESEMTMEE
jgi:hypothetical protein